MSRILLLASLSAAVCFFLLTASGRKKLSQFFNRKAHPLALAVFRMVLFFTLFLQACLFNPLWFNQIPTALLTLPWGLEWVRSYLPMNQTWLSVSYAVYLLFCAMGIVGLFTRTSAFFVTVLGLYVLGLPEMYGKLNHEHHILWFSAILALSHSADMFSIDAIWRAFRRANQGSVEPPVRSKKYGRPFVFILLLFGVIYFFPGFLKIWKYGSEWIFGDNLRFHLYWKWVEHPDWTPFFRIDQHSFLIQLSAFATVVFELSFIFLLFFPQIRHWLGLAGLVFHTGTNFFMRIPFWQLQTCYVVFFDWDRIFKRIGTALFPEMMYVLYDGNCKLCRCTVAGIRVFDILGRVAYLNAQDSKSLVKHGLSGINREALLKDMHVVVGKKVWRGYASYRSLAWRVPIVWLVLPFLYVWPISRIGTLLYRQVAISRSCSIPKRPGSPKPVLFKSLFSKRTVDGLLPVVGCFLIGINSWFGMQHIHSWPFTVYPTFTHSVNNGERLTVRVEAKDINEEVIPLNESKFRKKLTSSRWQTFLSNSLGISDPKQQHAYFRALWRFCAANDPPLQNARWVRFYQVVLTGNPNRRPLNPLTQKLLFEWDLSSSN